MYLHHELLMDKLGVLARNAFTLLFSLFPHFLHLDFLSMLGRLPLHLPILHRVDTIMAVLKIVITTSIN